MRAHSRLKCILCILAKAPYANLAVVLASLTIEPLCRVESIICTVYRILITEAFAVASHILKHYDILATQILLKNLVLPECSTLFTIRLTAVLGTVKQDGVGTLLVFGCIYSGVKLRAITHRNQALRLLVMRLKPVCVNLLVNIMRLRIKSHNAKQCND